MVTIVPTSTSAQPAIQTPKLEVAGQATRMLVDQVRSIDTDYVVGDPVDYLSHEQMAEADLALAHYLVRHDYANLIARGRDLSTTRTTDRAS